MSRQRQAASLALQTYQGQLQRGVLLDYHSLSARGTHGDERGSVRAPVMALCTACVQARRMRTVKHL